ncbi:hypothetical protein Agub_g986 [Astrephomene gubernaculifera]|uniref:Uncharacterized protein n=1 Tax=Astrephomene gubernaculifera TaxID=47775 RepID=A0AAD3DGM8_9CHLO|nr:hypothetical protein Agub_g986 [Astrephomene gubernaculifera]
MDAKRILDGLASLEGVILPSTPPSLNEEARRSSSDRNLQNTDGLSRIPAYSQQQQRCSMPTAGRTSVTDPCPFMAPGSLLPASGPTLAFFLQLQPPPPDGISTAVLPPHPQHQSGSWLSRLAACAEPAQRLILPPAPPPSSLHRTANSAEGSGGSVQMAASAVNPRALRNALLLLTFNSGAATLTALAKLHAAATATQGRAALAALQPVPLVARVFGEAVAAADAAGSEQAAMVLLALLAQAGLPMPDDIARTLVIPIAVRLLGGSCAVTAVADAAVTAAAAAATASGTLSSSNLHLRLQQPQQTAHELPSPYPHLPGHPPQQHPACSAPAFIASPPLGCRLAAARLLLHLATSAPNAVPLPPNGAAPSPGPGAVRDCLVAALSA